MANQQEELKQQALDMHRAHKGKLETVSKIKLKDKKALSLAYTPGVGAVSSAIAKNKEDAYKYTIKANTVAIVSDGTAVLGLGDIGPEAAMPVMEGKAILLKEFADVDAFPICLDTKDPDEIIQVVKAIAPTFGGINLEDISSPRCFHIEDELKKQLDIPVFHDDQHGTAIVVLAGLINALKLTDKNFSKIKIIVNGAGAAGIAVTKLLLAYGTEDITLCDSRGAIYQGRKEGMNSVKESIAKKTNKEKNSGSLADVIKGADVFIGISVANVLTTKAAATMAEKSIIFAMANPVPEIMPDQAKKAGAYIVATGRSDFPNQINNVLAFPGIFRGLLDSRAKVVDNKIKIAAAEAIANSITPTKEEIVPAALNKNVAKIVANAVKKCVQGR